MPARVNQFVASFIGSPSMNFVACEVVARAGGIALSCTDFELAAPAAKAAALAAYAGRKVTVGIRPEGLRAARADDPAEQVLSAVVEVVEPIGHEIYLNVRAGSVELTVRVGPETEVQVGGMVRLAAALEKMHFFDPQTTDAIA